MSEKTNTVTETVSLETESFEALLNESVVGSINIVGTVVRGIVVSIIGDSAIVDVGLKSEGRVPLKEFSYMDKELKSLDEISVFVERMEDKDGMIVLSHEKARREAAWCELEKMHQEGKQVMGTMFGKVKGGFTVDINGAVAFLPGSQLDVRPIKDVDQLMNIEQPFMILKMDRLRSNIVVSRRAVLEESRADMRDEVMSQMSEGLEIEGLVKNITDYGAFVDLGGIDGLLHITDMSWSRLNHPSEMIQLGDMIKVKVVRYNEDTGRVSLGMKQLESDPWAKALEKYNIGDKISGKVTNITDYGAFIEVQPGVEGLIHISEMSWNRKNVHPGKVLSATQDVEAIILEIDPNKRRIALGLKQCSENPWEKILQELKVGDTHEGKINNITEFGLFVSVTDDFDGMVHMSDLTWGQDVDSAVKQYKIGQVVKTKILEIDAEKERIALGIKQLSDDPFASSLGDMKKGDIVTCEVSKVLDKGVEVKIGDIVTLIRRSDLANERADQRPDRFAVGEKVDAKVTAIDSNSRQISVSIKAREISEEKEAMATYGSTDSGASLGDILGAAMDKAKASAEQKAEDVPKVKKEPAAKKAKSSSTKEKTEKKVAKKSSKKEADASAEK